MDPINPNIILVTKQDSYGNRTREIILEAEENPRIEKITKTS